MTLFRNIVFAAALAGLIAGVFVTVVHEIGTVPIILKAETYENAAEDSAAPATDAEAATESISTKPRRGRRATVSSAPPSP